MPGSGLIADFGIEAAALAVHSCGGDGMCGPCGHWIGPAVRTCTLESSCFNAKVLSAGQDSGQKPSRAGCNMKSSYSDSNSDDCSETALIVNGHCCEAEQAINRNKSWNGGSTDECWIYGDLHDTFMVPMDNDVRSSFCSNNCKSDAIDPGDLQKRKEFSLVD
jgi:hypothetical protein